MSCWLRVRVYAAPRDDVPVWDVLQFAPSSAWLTVLSRGRESFQSDASCEGVQLFDKLVDASSPSLHLGRALGNVGVPANAVSAAETVRRVPALSGNKAVRAIFS